MKITYNFRCKKCGEWNKENMDIDMSPLISENKSHQKTLNAVSSRSRNSGYGDAKAIVSDNLKGENNDDTHNQVKEFPKVEDFGA